MAVLHVNTEARSKALRYLELAPYFFKGLADRGTFMDMMASGWAQPCVLAVGWHADLIDFPQHFHIERPAFFAKAIRLEMTLDLTFNIWAPGRAIPWLKDILQTFPALKHLVLVFNGSFWEIPGLIPKDYDHIPCTKDLPKNEYYFLRYPESTVKLWISRVHSGDRGALEPGLIEAW
ncbi:hypothetical protein RRF57_013375 [Xylaria bambusicola]|uniref:Uncharacterized protein n=1 Tax=Xylaria bambusicola TaxID=326684 RepID=A0AAN7URN7_9PEZI